jgi:hypothetical protein
MEVNTWEEVLAFPPGRKHPYRDVHIKLAGLQSNIWILVTPVADKVVVVPKTSVELIQWNKENCPNAANNANKSELEVQKKSIESKYAPLSTEQLQSLCKERKINPVAKKNSTLIKVYAITLNSIDFEFSVLNDMMKESKKRND